MKIDRASAQTYARWFQALADPTRVVICNLLADAGRPMSAREAATNRPRIVVDDLPGAQIAFLDEHRRGSAHGLTG